MPEFETEILMVSPEHFDVLYAINPFMRTKAGELTQVDRPLAQKQWGNLKAAYESLGLKVQVIPGARGLPDMVFAANQSFPFLSPKTGRRSVILSNMRSKKRAPEVAHFEKWYRAQGFDVFEVPHEFCFEGTGDALLVPPRNLVLGGFGARSDLEIYHDWEFDFGLNVLPLELITSEFYHLDTCVCILDSETVAYVPGSISEDSLRRLKLQFARTIEISREEALEGFAANAHAPWGCKSPTVILHPGNLKFKAALEAHRFQVIEVDTSEFLKSGGSVFCLKNELIRGHF